jgi:hypothetical protein
MVDRFVAFGHALNQEDPTRPITFHGIENGGYCTKRDDIQIVNLHYPPRDQLADWRKTFGGRPVILGEFYAGEGVRCDQSRNPDPAAAGEAEDIMAKYYADEINYAKGRDLPGIMVHNLMQQGFFCPSSREKLGPWADRFKDPLTQYTSFWWGETVRADWPAESGEGFRPRMVSCVWGPINFFDPKRVERTPNKVFDAIAGAFRPMPPLAATLPPEVVVEVPGGAGVNVMMAPLDGQPGGPVGVKADANGRAWFALDLPGRYRVTAEVEGRVLAAAVATKASP